MLAKINQPFFGEIEVYGSPFKFSETPALRRGHAPLLGEHNEEILESLGYSKEEVAKLYEKGVLYAEPAVAKIRDR